jgi:hypothetical protein
MLGQETHIELISTLEEDDLATILNYSCEIVGRKIIRGKIPEE